jgi:SAM-dependent methyltransferase
MTTLPDSKATLRSPHPFPARMAPEIAVNECQLLAAGGLVVDPMCGSGTVLRAALLNGHQAIGSDLDPLAVLMARVWTSSVSVDEVAAAGDELVGEAESLDPRGVQLPWIDDDPETRAYVDFWFGPKQQLELRRLSALLAQRSDTVGDALKLALSRIIITKDRGASLARDVSHSRPHKAWPASDFEVLPSYRRSLSTMSALLTPPALVDAKVIRTDARHLSHLRDGVADLVVTSPPYLNGIDYLRGHRLSLVWLGYRLADLRDARQQQVGAERRAVGAPDEITESVLSPIRSEIAPLPPRQRGIIERYAIDLHAILSEICRILKPDGRLVTVVGDTTMRGVLVRNAALVRMAASLMPLELDESIVRTLPESKRYLPPPGEVHRTHLDRRLRTESVLRFRRVADGPTSDWHEARARSA